jgi:hypothetical protein
MDRQHLYQIPESIETHPYLLWRVDPRLRRYIHQRIPADYLPARVVEIAQILVSEVQQLDLVRQDYPLPARNLSGSISALLAHILFFQKKVRLVGFVEILQRHFQGTELRDVYQVSLIVISHPAKFLRNFQPQLDWYPSLCWYSHNKFQKSLTDELRRLAGDNFKRTNLGLLKRCSPSQLETCLKQLGERGERLEGLLLLHQCFQEAVVANQFVTNNPQAVHYDALLVRYRERKQVTDLEIDDSPGERLRQREAVQELLTDLSNMIRNDRQQITRSLDAPLGSCDELGTLSDLVADVRESASLENCELRELALDLLSKNSIVHVASIPPDRQVEKAKSADRILFLLYGLRLTQVEAGIELDCNQTTIGRSHDRQIAKLAQDFYLSYHKLPATAQISIEILDEYGKYIKSLCEDYYAELAINLLTAVIETTPKSSVVEVFIALVETQWQFRFKPGGAGLSRVEAFVKHRSVGAGLC